MADTVEVVNALADSHSAYLSTDDAACTLVILMSAAALRMKQCRNADPRLATILDRSAQSLKAQLRTMDRRGVLGVVVHLLYAPLFRREIERLRVTVRLCDEACASANGGAMESTTVGV